MRSRRTHPVGGRAATARGLLALVVAGGCAGELENPERFADCPPGYVEQLFTVQCGPGCHDAVDRKAELDLVSTGAGERARAAVSTTAQCGGRAVIDASGGLLLEKVTGATCGAQMPLGAPALSAGDVECVRRWVEELAP
ncbi:MAG: hypothetical protein R3B06_07100 [Kofleriaceae bacterium]